MNDQPYHIPALLDATIKGLDIKPDGTYVDVTFGGGGHSRAIMRQLGGEGRLLSFDQDADAMANAIDDPRFTFVYGNFRFLRNFLRFYDAPQVDGILADLGVSFHHFDDPERGFSFRFDGPLDMRMNRRAEHSAAWLLANASEEELTRMFTLYGELRQGKRLARAIVKERDNSPVDTVERLIDLSRPFIDKRREKKELAQVFQALRIEVNGEMEALQAFLRQTLEVLKPGGRLAIITYHSLEDRLVKNFMRTGNLDGQLRQDFYGRNLSPLRLLTSKPIIPDDDEIESNPRSRSAKLRIAEKI
ncbi:16S rRNA (cytosine(1402)-N(4))-methyltransferase RsmH [Muribaculum intestinale]|uniref:Ribosomal RNA small subunit methyltransferase H n=1 Tax=Muribaculum intestinale TaxID=1796646 RepID=A0A1B1SBM5_9BACT|nr:16S rRNA (cytosine(1402)-N(4))-methyltransferase RsmH [Muribaculum intestinale]ANU64234.1 16S rRNA (cytosine(1402)-N(4))-methyltransferase [Muribaculum intestinale]ASB37672.1 16S rRNA (cytosine(1402)-N(4))-methyltransferase [Muribaculum intestinale]PWB04989.1 16S rRNA (cytosine(1402)-N(4))-methyltransferase RsmH [Muribaculum intestinale]PWB11791.1 16S rRNA (cytosine(1402)-N(4))-methyltransferase RsmH [Muribaculum intestinale]QQR08401.1 16S rRNA (cytosine(1402)-N(4))-methyltransferase RsmH [